MAGGTLFIKVLPEKGAEAAIGQVVERAGGNAEQKGKDSGSRFGLGFAAAAGVAIGRGLQQAMALENIEISLRTLLGSAGAAKEMLGDLTQFARDTPFEMQGLAENARSLLGVGLAADDVIPTLQTLGDASAALGLNQEQMDRVIRAVTQSMAKGKFQAEEMMQMAEAGIPIYGLMAEALGTTVPEMQEMAKNGELLAEDTLPKLLAVMNANYAGGMVAQSKTLSGVISTLKDDINLGLAAAVQDLIPLLVDLLPSAGKAAGGVITAFGVGLKVVTTIATPFVQALDAILEGFGSLPPAIQTAVVAALLLGRVMGGAGLIGFFISFVRNLISARTELVANARAASGFVPTLQAVGRTAAGAAGRAGIGSLASALVGGWWGAAVIGIGALVAGLISIGNHASDARARVEGFIESVDFSKAGSASAAIDKLNRDLRGFGAELDRITQGGHNPFAALELFVSSADENFDATKDAIDGLLESQRRYDTNVRVLAEDLGLTAGQLERLAAAGDVDLNLLASDDPADLAKFLELLQGANAAIEAGWDPTSALGEAMLTLGDNAATAGEKADALKDALDALFGADIGVKEAEANWQEALDGLTEAFQTTNDAGEEVFNDLARAAVDAAGNIDLTSEAGRNVQDAVLGARDAMTDAASAAYNLAISNGDVAGAAAAAGTAAQRSRDQFIEQMTGILGNRDAAVALADAYGLVPGEVATAISTPGMSQTQLDLITVNNQLRGLPPNTPVTVNALTAEAEAKLKSMGFTVTHLPDGSVSVQANTAAAEGALNFLTRPRTVSVSVRQVGTFTPRLGVNVMNAEGGRLDFLAAGGMRAAGRNLSPMRADWARVVPPDTWRVIGDRAVGREWFIPENAPNTLPVLADAAAAHGLQLVRAMAAGGLLGRPITSAPGGRVWNIVNNLTAVPSLPTVDQLYRMQRRAEVLAPDA